MHPINGFLVGITSADIPGATCRYVAQQFDDKMVVVWSQVASGDQNPLYQRPSTNALASLSGSRVTGYELPREPIEAPLREGGVARRPIDPRVADNLERWIESQGQLLGEEVIRVMTQTTRTSAAVRLWGAARTLTCPARRRTDAGREGSPGTRRQGGRKRGQARCQLLGSGDGLPGPRLPARPRRACFGSSVRGGPLVGNARPMKEDKNPIEPSEESLTEIPEQDFSRAIRPNRYANLRGAFRYAVFVDREVWEHFRSEERIRETLRLLVDIAKKRPA